MPEQPNARWSDIPALLAQILHELRGIRRDQADLLRATWASDARLVSAAVGEGSRAGSAQAARRLCDPEF